MLDLVDCIEKGIEREPDSVTYHRWCLENIPSIEREYDDSIVHTSDISVVLEGQEKKCHRELWYRLNGYPKKPNTLGEKIMFDHGLRIQVRFSYLMALGLPEGYSIDGIMVIIDQSSESDLVISGPIGDIVVEIKTARGQAFRFMDGPRERHVLQCSDYMELKGTELGAVLYIDREGQNPPVQFNVTPDLEKVYRGRKLAKEIARKTKESDVPKMDTARVKIRQNKSADDAVYIDQPWQCEYCKYRGITCSGIIDPDETPSGIVGRINDEGVFYTEDYPEFESEWRNVVYNSEVYKENYEEGGETDNEETN